MPIDDEQRPPEFDKILEGAWSGCQGSGGWVGRGGCQRKRLIGLMRNYSGGFLPNAKTHRRCAADCKRYAYARRTLKGRMRYWRRRRGRKKCGAQRGANGCEDENLQFHGIYWMSSVFPDAVGSALAKDPLRVSEDPPGRGLGDNARRRFSRRIDDFYYFLSIPSSKSAPRTPTFTHWLEGGSKG